jgi:hypothetical protein
MQFVVPNVHTICLGLVTSMGSFILTGGEITKCIALPHVVRQCFFFINKGGNDLLIIKNCKLNLSVKDLVPIWNSRPIKL